MLRFLLYVFIGVVVVFLALAGMHYYQYGTFIPETEKPLPEGPQDKEALLAEMRPIIAPLKTVLQHNEGATMGGGLSPKEKQEVLSGLGEACLKYQGLPFAAEAYRELAQEIVGIAEQAQTVERWQLVQACVEAHDILGVSSVKLGRFDERAELYLSKPMVTVRGFMEDKEKNDIYVFIEMLDRKTGKITKTTAREGEEFNDLKLIEIIGRNKQVRFEYLKIPGLTFVVDGVGYF